MSENDYRLGLYKIALILTGRSMLRGFWFEPSNHDVVCSASILTGMD